MTRGTGHPFGSRRVIMWKTPFAFDHWRFQRRESGRSWKESLFYDLLSRFSLGKIYRVVLPLSLQGFSSPHPLWCSKQLLLPWQHYRINLLPVDHLYPTWATWRLLPSFSCLSSTKRQTSWLSHRCLSNARAIQPQGRLWFIALPVDSSHNTLLKIHCCH